LFSINYPPDFWKIDSVLTIISPANNAHAAIVLLLDWHWRNSHLNFQISPLFSAMLLACAAAPESFFVEANRSSYGRPAVDAAAIPRATAAAA
jgi:hypothetical protein